MTYSVLLLAISLWNPASKRRAADRATLPVSPLAIRSGRQATWSVRWWSGLGLYPLIAPIRRLANLLGPLARRAPWTESGRKQGRGDRRGDANASSRTDAAASSTANRSSPSTMHESLKYLWDVGSWMTHINTLSLENWDRTLCQKLPSCSWRKDREMVWKLLPVVGRNHQKSQATNWGCC